MSNVVIKGAIPSDGNPEGLISAPKNALFHKSGSIYKINYLGMITSSWQTVVFSPFNKSSIFITEADLAAVPTASSEAYLYVKELNDTVYGWKFLSLGSPTYNSSP